MNLTFIEAIAALGQNAAFTIANGARALGDYLFATFLPEINKPTYDAKSGTMTVRSTMAGLVGMDSNYPPSGIIETGTFNEQTAKIALSLTLPEAALRELQALLQAVGNAGNVSIGDITRGEALNFLNKAIIQPMLDTEEYLRSEALQGAISWTMNGKVLAVNYGVPAGNITAQRTGTAAYDGAASAFWSDMRAQGKVLKNNVRARILHSDTLDVILSNPANALQVTSQQGSQFQVKRFVAQNGTNTPSSDARDTVTLTTYDKEGEVFDTSNPGQTIKIPFMPRGVVLAIGNNTDSGYRVGEGSTASPLDSLALGYTHIAPTIEGGGLPGRWAALDTPAERPWQLRGRGVSNVMPVIEAPGKIARASTAMPS